MKPCYRCGRRDPRLQQNFDGRGTWFVYCYGERVHEVTSCGLNSELYATKELAIEGWNKAYRISS
jgi:hypothetical protein